MQEYWYRVIDRTDAGPDEQPMFSTVPVPVRHRTPKGVKLEWWDGKLKQVYHDTLNKPAQPTRELAMRDYLHRKHRHIHIVQSKLVYLRRVISALENDAYTTEATWASFADRHPPEIGLGDIVNHVVTTL